MEDHRWEDSAKGWEQAYKIAKSDRDALEARLRKICEAGMKVQRGCDCEYDYRCGNCQSIVTLHNLLQEMVR